MSLRDQINEDMKSAMRAKDMAKLGTIRLITAAIKQKEVDERIEITDAHVLAILEKMVKQRKDSIEQFTAGGRDDLANAEKDELTVLATYLPKALSTEEVQHIVNVALLEIGANGMQDMGKVMGLVRSQLAGRADMGEVSAMIKAALSVK